MITNEEQKILLQNKNAVQQAIFDWNNQSNMLAAWSKPVAANYGGEWHFFVKADMQELTAEDWFIIPKNWRAAA